MSKKVERERIVHIEHETRRRFSATRLVWEVVRCAALVAFVVMSLGRFWRPDPIEIEPSRMRCAVEFSEALVDELRQERGEARSIVVLPFVGDLSGFVYESARGALTTSGAYDVGERTFGERVRRSLGLYSRGVDDPELAARRARRLHADQALIGRVTRFEQIDGKGFLTVEWQTVDSASGQVVATSRYDSEEARLAREVASGETESDSSDQTSLDETVASLSNSLRDFGRGSRVVAFVVWALAVLLLPLVSIRFLELATAKKSNAVNAFVLLFYLALDAAFAWLIVRPELTSTPARLFWLVALLCAFVYNVNMAATALRRNVD